MKYCWWSKNHSEYFGFGAFLPLKNHLLIYKMVSDEREALMPNHLTFRFLIYFILQNCRKMLMLQQPVELGKIEKKKKVLNQSHKN